MEKEFIPYEEALALKELGFDEPCFGFYFPNTTLIQIHTTGFPNDKKDCVLAPTFFQTFRWFREKYSLDGWVVPYHSLKGKKYSYIIEGSDFYLEYDTEELDFDTYEEAELECLKKLIEIAKKDDN